MTSWITQEVSSPTPGASTETTANLGRDRWFFLLWPAAVLFHLAGNGTHLLPLDEIGVLQIVMAAIAIGAIVRPTPKLAAVLAAVYLVVLGWKLPFVGNHEVLLGLVAMIIVISVPLAKWRGQRWLTVAAPAVRLVLIIGYGLIAFSKLNSGFFDLAVSCAVIFGDDLLGPFGPSSDYVGVPGWSVVGFTAGIELAIPVLLVVRRLRSSGVLLAIGFHFLLAIDPSSHVWDFSAALLPMFLLFGSNDLRVRLDRLADRVGGLPRGELALGLCAIAALQGLVLIIDSRLAADSMLRPWFGSWLIAYPIWLVVGGTVLVFASRSRSGDRQDGVSWVPAAPLLVVVVLAAVNGLGPYFEYRSAAAFNMYSNLEIVDGRSNHLLIGGYGDRSNPSTVRIVSAEPGSSLEYYVRNDLALPIEHLDRYLKANPLENPMVATADLGTVGARSLGYGLNQPQGLIDDIGDHLQYKLGFRRAIDATGTHRCLRVWGPLG